MIRSGFTLLAATAFVATVSNSALADGDLNKGKRIYNKCKTCHVLEKKQNKIGPHLVGIMGRKAGSVTGFKYSGAMKNAGLVWDEKTLDAYITDPKKYIPGNKMTFAGLNKEDDRKNVIAYIKHESSGK